MVIAGKSKGQSGSIARVLTKKHAVIIAGMNLVKRHRRPTAQNRSGQIVEKPMPIHISNVQIIDPKSGKPSRIKISRDKDGVRSRVAVKSGEAIK